MNQDEFIKGYNKLLIRLEKAEKFFLDEKIENEVKIKFIDEFNKIQREIVKMQMQREYKNIFNADIEESLKHLE